MADKWPDVLLKHTADNGCLTHSRPPEGPLHPTGVPTKNPAATKKP